MSFFNFKKFWYVYLLMILFISPVVISIPYFKNIFPNYYLLIVLGLAIVGGLLAGLISKLIKNNIDSKNK